jgi:hypothetical protein
MGRRAIFDLPKSQRYQGVISKPASRAFERARKRLKQIAKWKGTVSDADVIEYLARGEAWTIMYLEAKTKITS